MSWLEPVRSIVPSTYTPYCYLAACGYGANWAQEWLFATSFQQLQSLAVTCSHPSGTDENVIGTREADGSFASRKTAKYLQQLAEAFASIVHLLLSHHLQDLSLQEARSWVPVKNLHLHDFPFSSEDGGGLHSEPDWRRPGRSCSDILGYFRKSIFDHILSNNFHKKFLAHISKKSNDPPFSEDEISRVRCLFTEFLQKHQKPVVWTIRQQQPMHLMIMHALQSLMPNEDLTLFPSLVEGVSTGFEQDVPASRCFPINEKPPLLSTPLSVHLANWQSAEKEPETTPRLVQEELGQGWAYRFVGTLLEAKEKFPHLAVGRLGVAFSDNRTPRLVVDSSICGLNNRCVLPERTTLPSAKDVIGFFPLRDCRSDLAGFSLDIKSAHKRVVIRESEQGPLGFQLNGILYFHRVCPFGATFSTFWWQGLGAWILRFFSSNSVDQPFCMAVC